MSQTKHKDRVIQVLLPLVIALATLLFICRSGFADDSVPADTQPVRLEDDMGLIDNISGRGMFRPPGRGTAPPSLTYSGWWAPQGNPGATDFNLLNASATAFQSEHNLLSVYTLVSDFHINSPPVLPSGAPLPGDLGRIEVGTRYSHKLSEDSSIGGGASFGSASDKPLSNSNVDTYSVNAFYQFSSGVHNAWVISLFYSNNNPISDSVPIPGFMYIYHSENFIGIFGFPFASILWRPAEPWTVSISMFGPTGTAELAYGHRRTFQTFTGFRLQQQSYLRADRTDLDDRIRENESRAYLGVRFPLASDIGMEIQGGYAFDRFIGEDDSYRLSDMISLNNSADLGNSFYIAMAARLGF